LLFISLTGIGLMFHTHTQNTMSYNEFLTKVDKKAVKSVAYTPDSHMLKVHLKNDKAAYKVPNPKTENFTEFLLLNNIEIVQGVSSGTASFLRVFIFAALGGITLLIVKKRRNGHLISDAAKNPLSFITLKDIAGNVEAKTMVDDIIQFIQNPDKYSDIGAKMPRGILFYGPPGTGKTLMAKAIAGEAKVPFFAMSGSDFVQTYVGVGAGRVRDLFKKAKKTEKAVIFIDEIDTIGKKRGNNPSTSNDERDQTLNALLTEMSGFKDRSGIIVIAATNRIDTLDEALTRPGRFDRQIEIGLPDINAREKILDLHSQSLSISEEVSLSELAKSTVYFSGAMLENLLNEAAILAANEQESSIKQCHIEKAFYSVIAGAEKSDRSCITEEERKVTAFHEAGHTLMTRLLLPQNYISKVTIIPSVRGAGGFSLSIPKDSLYLTKKQLEANIKVLFAGRAAEELIFGKEDITTGASNDISKASNLLMDYIGKYGMDEEMGLFHPDIMINTSDTKLLEQCRIKSQEFYLETKTAVAEHIELLEHIADDLLRKETLNHEDIEAIICEYCNRTC
jgi:cell division protease FtsH